ncbi:hypothetical protein YC2023_075436 [Brassica napus]
MAVLFSFLWLLFLCLVGFTSPAVVYFGSWSKLSVPLRVSTPLSKAGFILKRKVVWCRFSVPEQGSSGEFKLGQLVRSGDVASCLSLGHPSAKKVPWSCSQAVTFLLCRC